MRRVWYRLFSRERHPFLYQRAFFFLREHLLELRPPLPFHPSFAFGPGLADMHPVVDHRNIGERRAGLGTRFLFLLRDFFIRSAVEDRATDELLIIGDRADVQHLPSLIRRGRGDSIGTLVTEKSSVPADLIPFYRAFVLQAVGGRIQALPDVLVEHVVASLCFPAVLLPTMDPHRDALDEIGRIGVDLDVAGHRALLYVPERLKRGRKLHAVIGGSVVAPAELGDLALRLENDGAPTARTRVATRRAVGEYDDGVVFHVHAV